MKSWKFKVFFPLTIIILAIIIKLVLWDFKISSGKRVGNLTKISKRGRILKTWEGTIDEGSGDQLTSLFSVASDKIGQELYKYEGRKVIIYYNEHILGWPRDTKYDVVAWKPKQKELGLDDNNYSDEEVISSGKVPQDSATKELSKTLFCSMLGSLYKNKELYQKVKDFVKEDNLYLYNQYKKCND